MGFRGPLGQPDNVRHLRGNPGHRESGDTVKPPPDPPSAPTWLDREAKAEWRRVVPALTKLGLLSTVDRAVLAAYCDAWSKYNEARRLLDEGLVVKNRDDRGPTKNPAWQIYRDAAQLVFALAKDLGLAPAARLRMRAAGGKAAEDDGDGILD